jgi:hypothetical protein
MHDPSTATVKRAGGCHCGRVRFEVETPVRIEVAQCNCSICAKAAYLHLIVPKDRFRLLAGRDDLTTYTFNTGVAQHTFCKHCGVKSFYVPRSHPEGVSARRLALVGTRAARWTSGVRSAAPLSASHNIAT